VTLTPVVPMIATLATELPRGDEWSYEVKWDGYRALLIRTARRTQLVSRNLKDLTRDYAHIADAARGVSSQDFALDGEIVALDSDGRPSFQALQHRSVGRTAVVYYAFDVLHLGNRDLRQERLRERRQALDALAFASPILRSVPLPGDVEQITEAVRGAGLEGIVAKRLDSVYEAGRRSLAWRKVRFARRQEFVIGGYKPNGNGFDSVLVGYFEKRRLFYAGKVRAGFTPRTRTDLFASIANLEAKRCPFVNLPNSTGKSHWGEGITAEEMVNLRWVEPQVVVEVTFTEWTAGSNLRHAAFAGIRTDKRAADVRRV
jgi:bifunctional non-homologous end joining protein LigD